MGLADCRCDPVPLRRGRRSRLHPDRPEVGRTVRQTPKEIRKLEAVGAVEQVGKSGKREYFASAHSDIAVALLSLPELLVRRLGEYRRTS